MVWNAGREERKIMAKQANPELKKFSHKKGWIRTQRNSSKLDKLGDGWPVFIALCREYPDFLLDLLRDEKSDFGPETFIQRIMERVMARYQHVAITGCRGATKTSCVFKVKMGETVYYPGIKLSYYGPAHNQMAKVGSATYRQIEHDYPILARHFIVKAESVDRFEIVTRTGSSLAITAMRGDTIHQVIAEEFAQEGQTRFDHAKYKTVVLPAVRGQYMINGQWCPGYVRFKKQSITSAGRRQNYAYERRLEVLKMAKPESRKTFVMDIPFGVILLLGMRPVEWAEDLKHELTPDEWAREMESIYMGSDENPIVSDDALTEARCLLSMEEHHCCKDSGNKLAPQDVFYIVGYDVSYEDGSKNAKCACVVVKCTKQTDWFKRDKYLKEVVWVDDWSPMDAMAQAKKLKTIWNRFCVDGSTAYIAIDSWQYGSSVRQSLMMDLQDGLAPLCCYEHEQYTEFELENALPVIYPIKAGGVGTRDPDSEMIRNAEIQFEYRNVHLLTNMNQAGLEAYKQKHRIKDDTHDFIIVHPYRKTDELVQQIQNLKKVPNAGGVAEKRISKSIQRDSWSALKYALRLAQVLERKYLLKPHKKSDWDDLLKKYEGGSDNGRKSSQGTSKQRIPFKRQGGRMK